MTEQYDVVIIGAGLGGLECGFTLSREGWRVCVLEKNARPGGCFQSFCRDGHVLDTGIHYVGSLDEGKILRQYFKYFGIWDDLHLQRLDESAFDVVCYGGKKYPYAMGGEAFAERLAAFFPKERTALRQYVSRLQEVGDLIAVRQLEQGRLSAGGMGWFTLPAWEEIRNSVEDPLLQQVLAGTNLLYGGIQEKSAFYHHAMINNSNLEGAYRFIGGSQQVTDLLTARIRRQGGEVRCGCEAKRLITGGGEVTAVETGTGERIVTRYVISAIHPCRTLELLGENTLIKKAYVSRIRSLENSYGIFTAYLMLEKDRFPYRNRNYYLYQGKEVWYDASRAEGKAVCLLSMSPAGPDNRYADVVSLMTPMYMEELRPWTATTAGRRGEDYESFKARKAEELIQCASPWFPELKPAIRSVLTTTPLSFRDFTGTEEGSAYGVVKDYRHSLTTLISPRTKIGNLLLTGQNLNVHGALGVTLTAMLTCAELLGTEYLAKKISRV